ncbi:telomere-binding protein 1-like [Lolium rigidum]|uniref:telomere-binding protein 1-like n=1 Tax=Lolium rigidum TaxID=89674 RepID=UPI001F5E2FC9|nr:telomere-binding protein 1-like [Lolium rigidum]
MVFRKKLDEGSGSGSGTRQPRKPRAAPLAPVKRSARLKKKQMYALNLLATVAESLSSDEDGSSSGTDAGETEEGYNSKGTSVKVEQLDEEAGCNSKGTSVKTEQLVEVPLMLLDSTALENGCSPLDSAVLENGCPPLDSAALENDCCRGYAMGCAGICASLSQTNLRMREGVSTQNVAGTVSSESLIKEPGVFAEGSLVSRRKPGPLGHGLGTIPEYETVGVCPPCSTGLAAVKQEPQSIPVMITSQGDGIAATRHSAAGTMDMDVKPLPVVIAESSSGMHLDGPHMGLKSDPSCSYKVQHAADRDDDEKFPRVHPSTSRSKGGYLPHYLGDCRTRRFFATRMRKAARNKICGEMSNKGNKLSIRGKKISTTRRRAQTQRTMHKTKKVAECYSAQPSDEETLTETSGTSVPMGGQDAPCASESGQKKPCAAEGYNVKFIIKSFNIPEVLIEVPEDATVGSLKRIVTDAVTDTIEGGLRVRVLLQGKIIQDDNTTLQQAGICHGAKLDSIGFSLECVAKQDSDPSVIAPEETRPVGTCIVQPLSKVKCEEPSPSFALSDPVYSFGGAAQVKSEIQGIDVAGTSNVGELAIVPHPRSKQRDFGQRRKRRPFSIPEVVSLVEAVEKLGFGRWKNVKYHAFGDNQERTYVDLKDKWKNLVHTASIPPQLRRGQAIPTQDLLDRVLAAQAYWSVRQPKLEDHHQP